MNMTREQFESSIIGQHDDCGWDDSGYVAGVFDGTAFIARYAHCSCYDTFDALCGGGIGDDFDSGSIQTDWRGTPAELVDMARRCADPVFPDRTAIPDDSDYDNLQEVYRQVIDWYEKETSNAQCDE